ncbi:MAG: trypsin [Actinomycetota bacterium]
MHDPGRVDPQPSLDRSTWAGRLIVLVAVGFGVFMASVIYAANADISHPGVTLVRWLPYGDKVGHVGLWGLFTLLVNLALGRRRRLGRIPLGSVLTSAAMTVEELSQAFLSNRTLDAADYGANVVGIVAATVATLAVWRWLARRATATGRGRGPEADGAVSG